MDDQINTAVRVRADGERAGPPAAHPSDLEDAPSPKPEPPQADPVSVVELADVDRTYPGRPPVAALRGVDLVVRPGELLAVVGPSGSGKSTLLNIIGTLDRADAGTVRLDGRDLADCSDRELASSRAHRIGFVFQQFFLAPGASALDNVADGLLYTGRPRRERREAAAETLERVGLGDRAHHRPGELSGGQRQRVAIARALVGGPGLLLTDEPTGALDSATGEAIVELLVDLHRGGTAVIVITHDAQVAAAMPRRVLMRDGRIESDEAVR